MTPTPNTRPSRLFERARDQQALASLRTVHAVARKAWRRCRGRVELDELVSVGCVVLASAMRKHDPERACFQAYLTQRLRWAMVDELRRNMRRVAACSGVDLDSETVVATMPMRAPQEQLVERRQLARVLGEAMHELPPLERQLVDAHYNRGIQLHETARSLGMSRQRIWRLHRGAMTSLRERIEAPRRRHDAALARRT